MDVPVGSRRMVTEFRVMLVAVSERGVGGSDELRRRFREGVSVREFELRDRRIRCLSGGDGNYDARYLNGVRLRSDHCL